MPERLDGRIVVLEALTPAHEPALWEAASADPGVWDWMVIRGGDSRENFGKWLAHVLAEQEAGRVAGFVSVVGGIALGHSSYLNSRPHDRSIEIGNTWLSSSAWNTGANVETKYLLLRHAFEELGCLRVEFKTDAANERARRALAALPSQFEGIHRKHMLVRGGERRDSAWYSVLDDDWPEVRAALEARIERKLGAE
ncbi:MAG: N-acetyltransferase [Gaiellaceae bacterium]|jgi:RimJ/RimL family protein N-acetyltransferase|nr:N-acetyltransferase [Gaiellaceae bacterium]